MLLLKVLEFGLTQTYLWWTISTELVLQRSIIFTTLGELESPELTKECTETLIHAFISSRLDYCNSLLFGVPDYHLHKLQRVQNAAARLVVQ